MGGRGNSRGTFGGRGAAGDDDDTTVDDGVDGATNRACGADHGGCDATGQDPIDVGGGDSDYDRWVIVGCYRGSA